MFSQGKSLHFFVTIIIILVLSLNNCAKNEDSISESNSDTDNTTTSTDNSSATTSDTTAPTVYSVSPEDNSTYVAVSTTVAVTFSKSMSTSTITTNTDNTTCSGSFRLSSDNFTTCIKMYAAPSASNSDKTFTVTPDDNLSRGTNYKIQITSSAADTSGNSIADNYTTSNGFTTYGTGTIRGTVRYDNNTAADNVSVSYALSGIIVDNTTTNNSGDYSQDNLSLGTYTLTFAKSNFNDASLLATLETDNHSITANVTLLADNCTSGDVQGRITDAVLATGVSGVSINVRSGLNVTSGSVTGTTATTANNGTYTLSSMNAGGYTIEASKSGYITAYFNVNVCGNLANQNTNISEELSSGTMRIVLHWGANSDLTIVDSHLTGPDNNSSRTTSWNNWSQPGRFHIYWPTAKRDYYYYTDNYTCTGCTITQMSDNVSLDRDATQAPGTETITIPTDSWRSGTYRYSAHDYTNRASTSTTKFAESGTTVKVYYNGTETTYNVPNSAGNLWTVFTIDGSTKVITLVNSMSFQSSSTSIQ